MTDSNPANWQQRASELEALGLAWLEQGRYDDAARLLLDALALHEANGEDQDALVVATYLGVALYENGKLDRAVAIWEEVVARGWQLPTVYTLLERHYEREADADAAERVRTAARATVPYGAEREGEDDPPAAPDDREKPAPAPGGRRRILLADDEVSVRDLVVRYLDSLGFEVETAEDGIGAFGLIRSTQPELVILDVYMPMMSGLDVLLRMRDKGITTPVIVISGFPKAELVDAVLEHGAVLLAKPISLQELRRLVEAKLALAGAGIE